MRRWGELVVVALVTGLVVLTALRFVHTDLSWVVSAASFASYATVGFLVLLTACLVVLAGAPRPAAAWVLGGLAVIGLVVQAVALVPLFTGEEDASPGVTVMSSNLEYGRGDPLTVLRTVRRDDVDVLVLQEISAAALRGLRTAGLDDLLPFRAGRPADDASGTMVFSRYRLGAQRPLALGNGGVDVRVRAPRQFRLLGVHAAQPVIGPVPWLADLQSIRRRAAAAVEAGPVVAVGDFNATHDHAPFRAVLATGLRDAAEQAGSGWQPTWPSRYRSRWSRPVITIDHVLTSRSWVAVDTRTVLVPRSDHHALVADLRWVG